MALMDEFAGNEADGLLEWAKELDVKVDIRQIDRYPTSASVLSEYQPDPPVITVYRYKPWEEWLQTICEQNLRFFAPWYLIPLAMELYRHLEIHDLYRVQFPWYDLVGRLQLKSLDRRAEVFTQRILDIPLPLNKFWDVVHAALRPATGE